MPCLDLVIIGWKLFEEGTRAVDTGSKEEEEGRTGFARTGKEDGGGISTEERVLIGEGTTGIGQEEERKEGRREETKSESEGKEGVLGATDGEVTEGRLGDSN